MVDIIEGAEYRVKKYKSLGEAGSEPTYEAQQRMQEIRAAHSRHELRAVYMVTKLRMTGGCSLIELLQHSNLQERGETSTNYGHGYSKW